MKIRVGTHPVKLRSRPTPAPPKVAPEAPHPPFPPSVQVPLSKTKVLDVHLIEVELGEGTGLQLNTARGSSEFQPPSGHLQTGTFPRGIPRLQALLLLTRAKLFQSFAKECPEAQRIR